MALIHPVARRYAMAFMESLTKDKLDQAKSDMTALRELIKERGLFFQVVASPILETVKKKELIRKSLEGRISAETLRFLFFLVAKERIFILGDVCQAWDEWIAEGEGKAYVLVLTAVEFSDAEKAKLQTSLDKKFKLACSIEYRLDKSLVGGFQVIRQNRVWDHSLKTQLERVKQKLIKAA
ncbi:MAG: ATP synthase F1 subunit delta [Spirochaetia bacterium]|nr:ATP synthase F1 subunit delta [Spirochaetia bacterium]